MIKAVGLGKTYGSTRAVNDLSFEVHPGSVTGFLGPNGSGKSTTMRLMLGLDRGDGATTYDGRTFAELDHPMRHVGALLEAKPFHPTRHARNHLRMLAAANRIADSRVDQVMEMVGLATVAKGKPKKFSLGMGQRLGIAAALLGDPDTLILDEPSNGLDPQGIQWLRSLLKHLAGEGRSVFVSSHLLQEMAVLADELVVIGRGKMLANGAVSDFISHSGLGTVEVRTPDGATLAPAIEALGATIVRDGDSLVVSGATAEQIGEAAHSVGARLHQLATRDATLEEAFLEATGLSEEFRGSTGDLA
ncbi:ATP-binding cassette domain-containing protein [Aeromicrobium ginsengisoli]|uniref:ATP-binding cassette domain-containing protein n=1 Tax=Aeromicrobium ginsengisoli TaxID=363867 RepID=A0A5M4F9S2_9ACTN|nr:ATP-binding cassette domain-containing protein [Aeromicrobium ginsengisoli]KAA1394467.1 ATP-binding cassette domain-containing protein [Aeromicrobium ginsengisoli]